MFKLSRVEFLDEKNDPSVSLGSLIGSPDLVKMYQFNYMHDIPWVMSQTTSRPESHFVYGFYGKDIQGEILKQEATQFTNVKVHGKLLSGPYATHHTKMMVLFFKDGGCKVVVHTANLIPFDWNNMTQGVWQSPILKPGASNELQRFRSDLVRYIKAYGLYTLENMATCLQGYNFACITDKFIASVPGNYTDTQWGLKRLGHEVPPTKQVVIQCSSIASLPKDFLDKFQSTTKCQDLCIVYPTVEQICNSLNGYGSGASIHLKRQNASQQEQYQRLLPHLYSWRAVKANRQMAAPHIKTYAGIDNEQVKWLLLTSANLSKQAWGVVNKKRKTEWIQSWEAGVLRVFDELEPISYYRDGKDWCIPYDLPLTKYQSGDLAWSSHDSYTTEDIHGNVWPF